MLLKTCSLSFVGYEESWLEREMSIKLPRTVIPMKMGIHIGIRLLSFYLYRYFIWIPACAGMTNDFL